MKSRAVTRLRPQSAMLFFPESPIALVPRHPLQSSPLPFFLCFLVRVEGCRTAFESILEDITAVTGIFVILIAKLISSTPSPVFAAPIACVFFLHTFDLCLWWAKLVTLVSSSSDIPASCYPEWPVKRMRSSICARPMPTAHWLARQPCASIQTQAGQIQS